MKFCFQVYHFFEASLVSVITRNWAILLRIVSNVPLMFCLLRKSSI